PAPAPDERGAPEGPPAAIPVTRALVGERPAEAPGPGPDPAPGHGGDRGPDDADPGRTRTFGPRPPRPPEPAPPKDRRIGLWVAVAVMAASFGGLAYWVTRPDPPDDDCPDEPWPPEEPGVQVVRGDPEGDGCPTFGVYDLAEDAETIEDMVLTITVDEEERRIRLGQRGDSLFLGDWDCDGVDTPGLYRWTEGEVEYYDHWPEVENLPYEPDEVERVERRSGAEVVRGEDGDCDVIEVAER
ncbi:MAG TPA: hypothetical protein VIL36_21360, partial [Acidimicrobiales bacterium]